jgi:hypothetical protein
LYSYLNSILNPTSGASSIRTVFVPNRPLLVFLRTTPAKTNSGIPLRACTLAAFINRRPRGSRRSHSASQPPQESTTHQNTSEPAIYIPNPNIYPVNPSQPIEPIFPAVTRVNRFYQDQPSPDRPDIFQDLTDPHSISSQTSTAHPSYLEGLYVSSVLPTRTPRDLQNFQHHCWNIYHTQPRTNYIHGLNESRQITTSPLHFENLLWRYTSVLFKSGITEEYYWIKRDHHRGRPDRPCLEPAYSITYPWVGTNWKVTQLDRLERSLPQLPVNDTGQGSRHHI